jgi:hypothetical protein
MQAAAPTTTAAEMVIVTREITAATEIGTGMTTGRIARGHASGVARGLQT